MQKVAEILEGAGDVFGARRVYGEPVERDGVILVPAAFVRGGVGGGGGSGTDEEGGAEGEGGGFGVSERPVGAWVIRDGEVSWRPSIDVTTIIVASVLISVAYFCFGWLASGRRG